MGRGAALLLVAALALSAAGVRGGDADEVTGDLKLMQGNWVFTADEVEARWLLEGDTLKATFHDMVFVCKLTLDPKASPHAADFFVQQGPDDVVGKTTLGIYKIEDGRVTFCVRRPGETNRPTEFKDIEDETFVFTIKKAA
jgi:uncharacterized protein (TIGR03067 family)